MNLVKLTGLLCLFLSLSFALKGQNYLQMPSQDSLQSWMERLKIPTVGVLTLENGKIAQMQVVGELKTESFEPENTIFNVASITKSITAYLTLTLVSEGKWDLDDPLYPYWVDPDVADDPFHKKLTTRHVLSHTTGFVNWRWMHESEKLTFDFEPGTAVSYSGEGYEYLRRALESKFGKTFRELIQEYIFTPFNMMDSELAWTDTIDENRYAYPHDENGERYDFEETTIPNAADDMFTTLQDLGKFSEAVFAKENLTENIYEEMLKAQSHPKEGVDFALGWVLFQGLPNENSALLSAGADKGVAAMIILFPESQSGIIMICNSDNGRALLGKIILYSLEGGGGILSRF